MYEIFVKLLQIHKTTPYAVSKATGISQATLSDWKLSKSIPKTDKMQKLADYFGVTLEYLLGWDRPLDDMDKRVHDIYGWKPGDGPLPKKENTPEAEAAEVSEEDQKIAILLKGLSGDNKHKAREYLDFLKSKQNQ